MLGEQGNTEQQNEGVHPLALSPSNQQVQQSSPEGGGDVEGRQSPAAALEPALQRSLQGSRYAQGRQDAGMGGPGQGYVQTKAMSQPPRPGANPVQKKHSTLPGSDQFALQLRESAGAPDLASVHSQAEQGVSGGGGALPHGGQIQDAFGHHDVSGVGAHVGGKAKEAGEAIGAQAYARGDQVAFNESPGLHTAAHEAAHVVQQRSGVQLDGGVGQAGDSYEQHADAVADKVVAGESAQGLLDEMSGGGDEGGGVQAKTEKSAPKASETPTESVDIAKLTKDLQKVQKDSAELTALADSWYQQSVSGNVKATKESTPDGAQSAATMDTLITKSAVDVGYASEADASQSPGVSSKADAEHHSPMVPEAFKVDPRDVSAAPVVDPSTPTMGSKAAMSNVVATGKGVETVWQAVDGAKADGVERAKRIGESAADQLEVMGVARPTIATADQDGGSFRDSNWTLTVGTQGGNQIYGPTADSAAAAKGAPAATTGAADATATDANSTSSGADSGASTAADSGSTSSASPTPKAEAPAASKAPPASSATPSYSAEKAQRVARVVNTVVHEARHAEQKHAVIRHYLQNPRSNEELQKRWEEIAAAARSKGATEEQIQQTLSEVGLRKDSWKDEAQAIQFAKHALAYKPEAIDAAAKAGGIPVHKESESLWERVRGILGMNNSSTTEATETPEGHTEAALADKPGASAATTTEIGPVDEAAAFDQIGTDESRQRSQTHQKVGKAAGEQAKSESRYEKSLLTKTTTQALKDLKSLNAELAKLGTKLEEPSVDGAAIKTELEALNQHLGQVHTSMHAGNQEAYNYAAYLQTNASDPAAASRVINQVNLMAQFYQKSIAKFRFTYEQYRALPEERDAHLVGEAAEDLYMRSELPLTPEQKATVQRAQQLLAGGAAASWTAKEQASLDALIAEQPQLSYLADSVSAHLKKLSSAPSPPKSSANSKQIASVDEAIDTQKRRKIEP